MKRKYVLKTSFMNGLSVLYFKSCDQKFVNGDNILTILDWLNQKLPKTQVLSTGKKIKRKSQFFQKK